MKSALIAEQHGFKPYAKDVEGSIVNYENLDNVYIRESTIILNF